MALREPPWPSGQKRERSDSFDVERESPLRIDTCLQTSSAISYAINGTRNHHLRSSVVNKTKEAGDLAHQIKQLKEYCPNYDKVIQDVASGLNFKRRGLTSLLDAVESGNVEKVVVIYRDRFARFGIDLLERTFKKHGTTFDVISNQRTDFQGTQHELAEDLLSVCNYFVAKNNGRRAAANVRIDKKGVLKTPNMSSTSTPKKKK